jgi:hypothetical protein
MWRKLSVGMINLTLILTMASASQAVTLVENTNIKAPTLSRRAFLPLIRGGATCASIPGMRYGAISPTNPYGGDVSMQPDMNLAVRGYAPTTAYLGLVDYAGSVDVNAPQLPSLFGDNRRAAFRSAYRVNRWDWNCNCRAGPIVKWDVTLLGLATTPGEIIHLPVSGYDIGGGYGAMVLYAEATRLTLKYTREDDVVAGYTLHLENICVEPKLLALYQQLNAAGRGELPALLPGQALGRAASGEIDVAVRDGGSFLDPRSRKDWWQGR